MDPGFFASVVMKVELSQLQAMKDKGGLWIQGSTYSQPYTLDDFTIGKSRYSFYRRLNGPQDLSRQQVVKKISTPMVPRIELSHSGQIQMMYRSILSIFYYCQVYWLLDNSAAITYPIMELGPLIGRERERVLLCVHGFIWKESFKYYILKELTISNSLNKCIMLNYCEPGSSSGKAFSYGLGSRRVEIFLNLLMSRLALGSTQPPLKWILRLFWG